jgi:hypothetical protein
MSTVKHTNELFAILDSVRPEGWIKGEYIDSKGRSCLLGWICRKTEGIPYPSKRFVHEFYEIDPYTLWQIVELNDDAPNLDEARRQIKELLSGNDQTVD